MPNRQHPPSRRPSLPADADATCRPEDLALAVIEANRRWWALQIEAMEAALAENTQQAKTTLENAATGGDALAGWPQLYERKLQRYSALTHNGFELAAHSIRQLNQLTAQLLTSSLAGFAPPAAAAGADDPAAEAFVERRVAARVIAFADRRRTAQGSDAASAHPAAGARRKAA